MAKKKITLKNLSDMTPEELLNNFPFTKENREHLDKIFHNTDKYDDEDYFDECYKVAREQLEKEEQEQALTELRNAISNARCKGLITISDDENLFAIDWICSSPKGLRIKIKKI